MGVRGGRIGNLEGAKAENNTGTEEDGKTEDKLRGTSYEQSERATTGAGDVRRDAIKEK